MDSAKPVGGSPTYYDLYAIRNAALTSVALMALSVGVMKGIERYAKRTITPFQKNIAGVLLTTVYMVAAAHFCGPFTKKLDHRERSDRQESSQHHPLSLFVGPERRSGDQEGVVVSQRVQLTVFRNPIDLTHVNSRKMLLVLRAFEQAIIRNGSRAIGCPIPLGGRVILILVDISTREKQARALKLCQQWKRFFREGKRGVLPPIQNESPPPLSIEYRSENIVALHPRRKGSKQVRFSAPQALLRKSPIDLTSVNPREIQNVLDGFREAIRMNGVRFVDCRVPLAGRMYWIHADISSPLKQQRALQACDYWESLILGNQQSEHALSLEEPLKTPDWVAFNSYVQQHCFGIDPMRAKEKALRGLQLIQKLHRNEPVEQDNLEEKLSDACWGLMLSAITRGQAFVEGTFDLTDPGHRLFHFFMPILYGRSSSHYKKRVIPVTEGYWKGYGHFGYDIGRDGQNDLPAYKRTVMLGRIITRDGTDRTYLKMENWGANLNFFQIGVRSLLLIRLRFTL